MQSLGVRTVLQAAAAGKEAVLELVLPPACRLCNLPVASGQDFCRRCDAALTLSEPLMRAACNRCGIPGTRSVARGSEIEFEEYADSAVNVPRKCAHCKNLEFQFDGVAALWSYQDRVCDAVVTAKYAHQSALGDALGRRLGERILSVFASNLPDLVTYVPSHLTRQFSRGGNGNQAIANAVAKVLGRPCHLFLRTTRRVKKQAWLDDAQRIDNVCNAFSPKKSYAFPKSPEFSSRHVLVIDDVLTTGATANEAARILLEGGSQRVSLGVIARAIRT